MDTEETSAPVPAGEPPLASSPVPVLPPDAASSASVRALRWAELILLLAVAFGSPLFQAFAVLSNNTAGSTGGPLRWLYGIFQEATALGFCAYILHRQGRTFRQLGLTARWFDPFYGLGIMILGLLAAAGTNRALYFGGFFSAAAQTAHAAVIARVMGPGFDWSLVYFVLVNAPFEELLVRAYFITELRLLTGSATVAVLGSAVFQGTYHLYQGWQAALAETMAFLVFSLFYVWSRRITPIIIAHALWDLFMVFGYVYWRFHGPH